MIKRKERKTAEYEEKQYSILQHGRIKKKLKQQKQQNKIKKEERITL